MSKLNKKNPCIPQSSKAKYIAIELLQRRPSCTLGYVYLAHVLWVTRSAHATALRFQFSVIKCQTTHRILFCGVVATHHLHFLCFLIWNSIIFFAGCEIISIRDALSRNNFACRWRPWTSFFFLALCAMFNGRRFAPHLISSQHARTASVSLATRRHFCFCFSLWLLFRLFRERARASCALFLCADDDQGNAFTGFCSTTCQSTADWRAANADVIVSRATKPQSEGGRATRRMKEKNDKQSKKRRKNGTK